MEDFTEEHSKLLLPKEWLVKVDVSTSTPYLFKLARVTETSEYCILITDTKKIWTEVLPRKHISRRWKQCNPNLPMPQEDDLTSKVLCTVHSASGFSDASFDILDSPNADLSFELEFEGFKWRWDTFLLGPRTSSDIISKHLIMPLITMAHVAFYSADPVSELSEEDLEKVVDKIGRAARRSVDTHVKHTIAKPRIATSLQRATALLGFVPELPSISSEVEPNDLESLLAQCNSKPTMGESHQPEVPSRPTATESQPRPAASAESSHSQAAGGSSAGRPPVAPPDVNMDSETESDSEDGAPAGVASSRVGAQTANDLHRDDSPPAQTGRQASTTHSSRASPSASGDRQQLGSQDAETLAGSKSESSRSPPPSKKPKLNTATRRSGQDSDSDSDDSHAGRASQSSQSNAGAGRGRGGAARGVRQPLKRGAKRF